MASDSTAAGALLIDKPPGPTSHDVVAFVRRSLRTSRVGHTGTLDPLATGLLLVLVGPATRLSQFLAADEKEYLADVRLGVSTPTYDAASIADGVRRPASESRYPTDTELDAALARFRGTFLQTPPPYSAKKIASVPAYERARKNQPVELKPVEVTVRDLERLDIADVEPSLGRGTSDLGPRTSDPGPPTDLAPGSLVRLRVAASAGFYVRSLAHDLGQALGCGGHLERLRRTRVGRFRLEDALTLDVLEQRGEDALIPVNALLGEMPSTTLTPEGSRRAAHGNPLAPAHVQAGPGFPMPPAGAFLRLLDEAGTLLAVAERRSDGLLHPFVVLG